MKLTAQERLKYLSRQVSREEERLAAILESPPQWLAEAGLQLAQEALATAEALLLLAVEREAVWSHLESASGLTSRANAETLAPPPLIPSADKS